MKAEGPLISTGPRMDRLTAVLSIPIREGERCWIGAMAGEKALLPVGAGDPVANVS